MVVKGKFVKRDSDRERTKLVGLVKWKGRSNRPVSIFALRPIGGFYFQFYELSAGGTDPGSIQELVYLQKNVIQLLFLPTFQRIQYKTFIFFRFYFEI